MVSTTYFRTISIYFLSNDKYNGQLRSTLKNWQINTDPRQLMKFAVSSTGSQNLSLTPPLQGPHLTSQLKYTGVTKM